MDGKAFIQWFLMDVLHKNQDLGAAAGPSECPLLCSCRAGNGFSSKAEQQQFSVGHHMELGRWQNRDIIAIFPV